MQVAVKALRSDSQKIGLPDNLAIRIKKVEPHRNTSASKFCWHSLHLDIVFMTCCLRLILHVSSYIFIHSDLFPIKSLYNYYTVRKILKCNQILNNLQLKFECCLLGSFFFLSALTSSHLPLHSFHPASTSYYKIFHTPCMVHKNVKFYFWIPDKLVFLLDSFKNRCFLCAWVDLNNCTISALNHNPDSIRPLIPWLSDFLSLGCTDFCSS